MEVEVAPSSVAAVAKEEFDCPVCHELLFEPCVPSCGHAFCKACLSKLLSHSSARVVGGAKCPVCRRVLHVTRGEDLAICSQFDRLLALHFADEHQARREAAAALAAADSEGTQARALADGVRERLPLFVMDATLPRQHLHLNVFEPRYVGMVHRALQGSRCFGMVGSANFGGMASHGVEVAIRECAEQWDGRFHLEVVGQRPFKILSSNVLSDGLCEAEVEYFDLEAVTDGFSVQEFEGPDEVEAATAEIARLVPEWEELVTQGGWERHRGHLALVREHLGPMPPTSQPGALAYWTVALFNPLPPLGVAPEMRPAVLRARSPAERVRAARQGLTSSMARLRTLERSWLVRVSHMVPTPLRSFLPAAVVLCVALVLSRILS